MGYELFLYDNNGKEIDFLAIKGGKEYLIQVAYSVAENKAYEHEIGAFASLDNSRAKVLITNDEIDFSTSTVRHNQAKRFFAYGRAIKTEIKLEFYAYYFILA